MSRTNWIVVIVIVLGLCLVLTCVTAGGAAWLWFREGGGTSVATRQPMGVGTAQPPLVPSPGGGNELRLVGSDPPTLDPALVTDVDSAAYVVEIFSGLVTLNRDLEIVPDLAERWDISDDGMVYTFYLKKDAKFQDGKPVTAQDFKYSLERACDPATLSPVADTYLGDIVGARAKLSGQADEVEGVEVVDDHTLRITIDAPKAYFLAKMTYSTAFVVDKENVESGGPTWTDYPNGTGPYALEQYDLREKIVLVRNENYVGRPKPSVERVIFFISGGSAMTMYENGELDAVPVGLTDIERVQDPSNPLNKELHVEPALSTFYIWFNVETPPFDDPKVRQAFNYAIDKAKISKVVFKNMALPADTILPPSMPGYSQDVAIYSYDPDKARQLLAESSYGGADSLPEIVFNVGGGGGAPGRSVTAIQEMIKQNLGIELVIQQTESATFYSDIHNHRYQMFYLGWSADYPDPQDFLEVLFYGSSLNNYSGYANPEVDALLEKAQVEADQAKRLALYQQAEKMILEDAPVVPLFYNVNYWLAKPYTEGVEYPPMIIPILKYAKVNR